MGHTQVYGAYCKFSGCMEPADIRVPVFILINPTCYNAKGTLPRAISS